MFRILLEGFSTSEEKAVKGKSICEGCRGVGVGFTCRFLAEDVGTIEVLLDSSSAVLFGTAFGGA